ncbi:MAG TPA: ABC transporter ATP-binding protein [Pirellulales bacterium]|jgi:multiple sugar transport system ATP-binding protein|nr:ABC transporter ATP-binding protein [Pirellulales bacterium]
MAGVILEHVSRVYPGGVTAVSEIDLEVRDREFLVLVGPSGSGKSTTLRMIAGLEPVSAGRIWIDGRQVDDLAPQRRNIAMVFQGQALYPHLSVYGNLAFGLELRSQGGRWRRMFRGLLGRREPSDIGERVRQAARCLGIEPLLERMPGELSGGERQRVALGRAMVREPAAFLFDEPLSNLDAQLRVEMRRELKRLSRQLEATVIYVTHDQAEALTLGDRIVVLEHGKVQQLGEPDEVYDRPANRFVAGFIGTPPMNLMEGRIGETESVRATPDDSPLGFAGAGWSAPVAAEHREALAGFVGEPVVLGIRPEHVRIVGAGPTGPAASAPVDSWPATARVAAIESLGDSMAVELELVGQGNGDGQTSATVWCKVEADGKLNLGDRVNVWLEMRRAHWFSARTGKNLYAAGGVRG